MAGLEPATFGWKPKMLPITLHTHFGAEYEIRTRLCSMASYGTTSIPIPHIILFLEPVVGYAPTCAMPVCKHNSYGLIPSANGLDRLIVTMERIERIELYHLRLGRPSRHLDVTRV